MLDHPHHFVNTSDTPNPSVASCRTKPSLLKLTRSPTTLPPGSPVMTTTPTSTKAIPSFKVPEGYARLPGAGYEALHPELEGVDPEDYPDIHKMAILADVAPCSREYRPGVFILPGTKNLARARQARAQLWNPGFSSTGLSPPSRVKGQACGLFVLPDTETSRSCGSMREQDQRSMDWRGFLWAFRGLMLSRSLAHSWRRRTPSPASRPLRFMRLLFR